MRPIDADALKEQIESRVVSMSVCLSVDEHYGKVTMREDCLQDIADAPTIEAIPVKWLLKKKASCMRMGSRAFQAAQLIGELIKEWQKEQEVQGG